MSKEKLLEKFKSQKLNNFIAKNNKFRIASFNVHMWLDYKCGSSYDKIIDVIKESNADIMCLQEALFFKQSKTQFEKDVVNIGYNYIYMCNNRYGINIILSKYKSTKTQIISLIKDPIKNKKRYGTRCDFEINNKKFNIVNVHLDVFDETEITRSTQITEILKYCDDDTILLGDFNSLRKDDYSKLEYKNILKEDLIRNVTTQNLVTSKIESDGFVDSFVYLTLDIPKITVWSCRRIDYMFLKEFTKYLVSSNVFVTHASDHFMIYSDYDLNK